MRPPAACARRSWGSSGHGRRGRRRGLGALLLATALESYRAAGYERSVLTVDTGNATGALRLYERAGYAVKDTSVVWTKPLACSPAPTGAGLSPSRGDSEPPRLLRRRAP